ncbi:thiamine pyrophosphate-dependent enzyme [Saccharopolyspora sp. NPDC050642]|uniref:thiamine pyrophosphate-dependent enzyme n=1 Tax=Saccharopolyspora sp. NPDC050642 TaxID=3157099 RepID=UPI0033D3DB84
MFLSSGGLGTMGYAIPAAMGAKLGRPDQDVWAVDNDGCFQMTAQELATCAAEGIPIKVALIDNSVLGMVRQWQTLFWDKHHSASEYRQGTTDYAGLARSLGCVAFRCDDPAGVEDAILRANAVTEPPRAGGFRRQRRRAGVADGAVGHEQRRHPRRQGHPTGIRRGLTTVDGVRATP